MSISLLATKLYAPQARPNLVPRPRLIARLNEGLARPLTLVSSPAGFGKITLLSEWIPQSERRVVWVALDEGDNDPTRFWAYFVAALQGLKKTSTLLKSRPPGGDQPFCSQRVFFKFASPAKSWKLACLPHLLKFL
ncbi:hypothetical protein L0337_20340 [candidate division KSB1 bacterium]|nr:hypothetical protein [candidate division KSB1 bacterium]